MTYRDSQHRQAPEPELTVAIYDTPHEAHLALLHLESLGIAGRTLNELVVGMAPHLGGGAGGIRVVVRESDAPEAHQALERLQRELALERGRRSADPPPPVAPRRDPARHLVWPLLGAAALALWHWLR